MTNYRGKLKSAIAAAPSIPVDHPSPLDGDSRLHVPVPARPRRRRDIVLDTDEDRSSPSPSSSKRQRVVLSNNDENAEDDKENVPPSKRTRVFEDSNVVTVPHDD